MSTQQQISLTIEEALKLLKEYSYIQVQTVEKEADQELLRQALLLVTSLTEYETLGVCADHVEQGFTALVNYLKALGYEIKLERDQLEEKQGAVYIKFNSQKMSYYIDSYTGSYRGVLISCQGENDTLVGTYGHFPLDLFD
ncbi:DUF1824 domain-containing protein [Aphanothece hegewaldii CCALA 016]|uniref:DUF1824 domain-containing protein n=1 Tax=Aphanothece hegewaldii CCALA 016 TaxID=2107694 RepID=A0A2T1LVY5_9CHRO|nr:DUF1824 family protein [Aphanothece hegewaldii]PSF36022.1 DUF1824 domain-containing protein [Aphanothece hegewaldii CCALA 016]